MDQGLVHASNMKKICKDIQLICNGTSDWFVPESSQKYVQADVLFAIRSFKMWSSGKDFGATKNNKPKMNYLKKKRILALRLLV